MAETFTGKLSFDKGKWKIVFFDEKKQKDSTLFCQKNIFASDFEPKEGEETEVDFERDSTPQKSATNVRAKGKGWVGERKQAAQVDYSQKNLVSYSDKSKFGKPKDFKAIPPKGEAQVMKREFHNPYNFVPAISRDHIDGSTNELGDREPSGHDRYITDLYSGKLRVKMRVETPLLILDTARMDYNKDKEHKSYPVRIDANGKPFIHPTSIKGMLRSAYEAITNSRLSIFRDHDERLAFRMESTEGARSVPARIERDAADGKLYVVLYTGTSELGTDGRPLNEDVSARERERNPTLCAAWINTYFTGRCIVDRNALRLTDENRLPNHKEEVFAWLKKINDRNGRFRFWGVKKMVKDQTKLGFVAATDEIEVKGYVCVTAKNTGKGAHPNIGNKHDERLFFYEGSKPKYGKVVLTKTLTDKWNDLIKM